MRKYNLITNDKLFAVTNHEGKALVHFRNLNVFEDFYSDIIFGIVKDYQKISPSLELRFQKFLRLIFLIIKEFQMKFIARIIHIIGLHLEVTKAEWKSHLEKSRLSGHMIRNWHFWSWIFWRTFSGWLQRKKEFRRSQLSLRYFRWVFSHRCLFQHPEIWSVIDLAQVFIRWTITNRPEFVWRLSFEGSWLWQARSLKNDLLVDMRKPKEKLVPRNLRKV